MHTNIVINNKRMSQALKIRVFKAKLDAAETGLVMLGEWTGKGKIRAARGKLCWHDDLDTMRSDA